MYVYHVGMYFVKTSLTGFEGYQEIPEILIIILAMRSVDFWHLAHPHGVLPLLHIWFFFHRLPDWDFPFVLSAFSKFIGNIVRWVFLVEAVLRELLEGIPGSDLWLYSLFWFVLVAVQSTKIKFAHVLYYAIFYSLILTDWIKIRDPIFHFFNQIRWYHIWLPANNQNNHFNHFLLKFEGLASSVINL